MIELRPAMTGQVREVSFGRVPFRYELLTSDTANLSITVYPDLRIRATAPEGADPEEVDKRVRRRGDWIVRQMEFFRQFLPHPADRRYVSGETHYYLGRQYRLKVEHRNGTASVLLKGGYIHVSTPEKNQPLVIREMLENWYRSRAKALFHEHMQRCLQKTAKYGINDAPMRIQKMNSRWGSFTPSGTIILNLSLIKAPVQCIDYVIIHELCHTKIPSHGPDFEHLLTRCLPDWRKRKARLEQTVITLMGRRLAYPQH